MKKNKKLTIIISVVIIIIIIIVLIIVSIGREKSKLKENIGIIKENYQELNNNVLEYNQIRTELIDKLSTFFYNKFVPGEYDTILGNYNKNIEKIDKNITNISDRCHVIYKDSSINTICSNYQLIYEKLINLYVSDLSNYNTKIDGYNEYKKANVEKYQMIHKDYIDYNNDKTYEGRIEDEEDIK